MRTFPLVLSFVFSGLLASTMTTKAQSASTWTADNGNGTYTNPLFYDEFSDPDVIRVGSDFYLAGTTMHAMPGIVVLHSRDLVNWDLQGYCYDKLGLGDAYRLEGGKEVYGQGTWAPCIRYNNGKFYVFSNINGVGLQVYIADKATGPWQHINMGGNIYDLSVLFDDDGRIYAVHGYDEVKVTEMKPDFSGYVEGSERVIIQKGSAMGEGHHIYKIKGRYYILSADYSPMGRMQCARADHLDGPWETTAISVKESLGTQLVHWTDNVSLGSPVPEDGFDFKISQRGKGNQLGCATLHQGGIVDLPNGDWWGVSMLDFRAVGRTTCLSPVTWKDGWPYFGLEGNLGRTPRTWLKPNVEEVVEPHAPYVRSDDFNGKALQRVWQWNHEPDDAHWRLAKGVLSIDAQPAKSFLWAKNTLTQRVIGPVSVATMRLDGSKLKDGDRAGLGLLNMPYATVGLMRESGKTSVYCYDQRGNETTTLESATQVWLRATCETDVDSAQLSYSLDGTTFQNIGRRIVLPYQMKTFQGARYSLFAFNAQGRMGGAARFDDFVLEEPMADRSANLPVGKVITLTNLADGHRACALPHGLLHTAYNGNDDGCQFRVLDRGNGRVALEAVNGTGFVTVVGQGLSADVRLAKQESEGSLFMWQDMLHGQCMLLSMKTHRYVGTDCSTGEPYSALYEGSTPDRKNGCVFAWAIVGPQ